MFLCVSRKTGCDWLQCTHKDRCICLPRCSHRVHACRGTEIGCSFWKLWGFNISSNIVRFSKVNLRWRDTLSTSIRSCPNRAGQIDIFSQHQSTKSIWTPEVQAFVIVERVFSEGGGLFSCRNSSDFLLHWGVLLPTLHSATGASLSWSTAVGQCPGFETALQVSQKLLGGVEVSPGFPNGSGCMKGEFPCLISKGPSPNRHHKVRGKVLLEHSVLFLYRISPFPESFSSRKTITGQNAHISVQICIWSVRHWDTDRRHAGMCQSVCLCNDTHCYSIAMWTHVQSVLHRFIVRIHTTDYFTCLIQLSRWWEVSPLRWLFVQPQLNPKAEDWRW